MFRVERLDHGGNRYKVSVNAEENRLSGVVVECDAFAVVVVEGVRKAVRRYHKLMTRRIDWSLAEPLRGGGGEQGDGEGEGDEAKPNKCTLVWQGAARRPPPRCRAVGPRPPCSFPPCSSPTRPPTTNHPPPPTRC